MADNDQFEPLAPAALGRVSRAAVAVMYPSLVIPVVGWIIAQGLTDRIAHNDQWTGAFIDTLAADVFAVILAASMFINATVAVVRLPSRPASFRRVLRLPLSILVLVGLGVAWIFELALSQPDDMTFEEPTALAIAAASVVVCVFASKRDPASTLLSRQRRLRRLQSIAPGVRQRRKRIVLAGLAAIAAGAAALGLGLYIPAATTPIRHVGCEINGEFYDDGRYVQLDTTNCGSFDLTGGNAAFASIGKDMDGASYTIVSRGWTFDLPPRQYVVSIAKN